MSQQGVFTDYFHEVESWCESVLQVLDSRAMEVYDVHMLAYRACIRHRCRVYV